jgi:hypothetical protein
LPSLAGDDDERKQRLRNVFRAAVAIDPVFSRAVDADDTRHALDEVAEYDTFRDGFLVLPTLQSMCVLFVCLYHVQLIVYIPVRLVTLPGEEEDVDDLHKLLDPQMLGGCGLLLTPGSGWLSLGPSVPCSPLSESSPVSFGWNRKMYRYSVPATPRYSVPPTPIS